MATTISTIFNKTLFQRLLDSKKSNTEKIYFNKTTTQKGESHSKIFDIDPTIFYKPFELEINYDITGQTQTKNTIGFFCCRYVGGETSLHVFAINKELSIDMSSIGSSDRINTNLSLKAKGKINIKYNEGKIQVYYDDKLFNNYDLSSNKITNGLPNKCAVGQSYSERTNSMANGINGTVNVKIKKL